MRRDLSKTRTTCSYFFGFLFPEFFKNTKEMTRQTNRSPKSHIYSATRLTAKAFTGENCMFWKQKRVNRAASSIDKEMLYDGEQSHA